VGVAARRQGVAALVATSVLWGAQTVGVKYAVTGLPPTTVLVVSLALASAALWMIQLVKGHARPPLARMELGLFEP